MAINARYPCDGSPTCQRKISQINFGFVTKPDDNFAKQLVASSQNRDSACNQWLDSPSEPATANIGLFLAN